MNKKVQSFDLTTIDGMAKAYSVGNEEYRAEHPVLSLLFPLTPFKFLGLKAGEAIAQKLDGRKNRAERVIAAQREAAISVIREGKRSGAKKVRVTMNQKAGIDLGTDLSDIPLKFSIGSDDTVTVEVEY